MDFWGGEYADNDVKRIVTKSGNRIQMVDKPGQEAISLSTPNNLKISLYEHANETGRPMIEILNRNGDITFLAPDGRIHFHSQLFSREVGGAEAPEAAADGSAAIVYGDGLGAAKQQARFVPAAFQEREEEESPEQLARENAEVEQWAREYAARERARQENVARDALKRITPEQRRQAEDLSGTLSAKEFEYHQKLLEALEKCNPTPENQVRIRQGLAPIGRDGKPVELPVFGAPELDDDLTGTELARKLGNEGEEAVGVGPPKVPIEIPGTGRVRIPDGSTDEALIEVKNVAYQSYTQQLRDFVTYSKKNNLKLELYVRPSTLLSGPLQEAIGGGDIVLKNIPGAK